MQAWPTSAVFAVARNRLPERFTYGNSRDRRPGDLLIEDRGARVIITPSPDSREDG